MGYTLWQGDCLERMREIPDGSVDLIAADLPYGTTACKWDVVIPFEPLWAHYRRVLKPRGAVVLTASQPFTSMLVMSNREWFKYCWVWEKNNATDYLNAKNKPLKAHEDVAVFSPGTTANRSVRRMTYNPQWRPGKGYRVSQPNDPRKRLYAARGRTPFSPCVRESDGNYYPISTIKFDVVRYADHPTQKPVALFEYLIRTYSNEGDTVLDNAMGSGTTGVACLSTGRRFIGIERDPAYFAIADRRLAALTPQEVPA